MNDKTPIIQFKDLLEQHKATVYDLVATVFAAGYSAGVAAGTQHQLVDAYAHLTICTRCGQIHDNRVDCHPGWLASKRINDALEPKSINETACPRCGSVSSRPNGEHYCHQRTDDATLPERDDPHEDLGYKGRGQ